MVTFCIVTVGAGGQTGTAWDEPPAIPEAAVELLERERERDRVVEAPAADPQVDLFRRRRSAGD